MKKLLIILGAIFLIVMILVAVGIGFVAVKGSALDKQSKAFVDRNVPLIFATWDDEALWSRASPVFMQATPKDKLDSFFTSFSHKFGKMQAYQGSKGTTYMNDRVLSSHSGEVITAVYTAHVIFDAGPADVKVTLIKHGDEWQIEGFNINSDVLLK
jgi:hypothetical protein